MKLKKKKKNKKIKDFEKLERKLNLFFKNKKFLIQAFVHRSYLNENPDFQFFHNERLEFLGDAVLELVVSQYLYEKYPQKREGELTEMRSALVNAEILSSIAKKLNFENWLFLSKGERKNIGKARKYILANTFEAFLGALYLDKGYEACRKFVKKYLFPKLPYILKKGLIKDFKTKFQEEAQERLKITPTYKVLKEWGPEHRKHFKVGLYLGKELISIGEGTSKQEAEEEAAKKGLEIKKWKNANH